MLVAIFWSFGWDICGIQKHENTKNTAGTPKPCDGKVLTNQLNVKKRSPTIAGIFKPGYTEPIRRVTTSVIQTTVTTLPSYKCPYLPASWIHTQVQDAVWQHSTEIWNCSQSKSTSFRISSLICVCWSALTLWYPPLGWLLYRLI